MIFTLQCKDIFEAKRCNKSQLEKKVLTWEEMESVDWKLSDNEYLLPSLGEDRFFINNPIIPIKDRKYRVLLQGLLSNNEEPYEVGNKHIIFEETNDNLTPPYHIGYYRFFGQPQWIQGAFYPADLHGRPCYHLVTVNNNWGDCGNMNVLVGLDLNGVPEVLYFEASCY